MASIVATAALISALLPAPAPSGRLDLAVHDGQSAGGRVLAAATLTCEPSGGSHPDAAAVCERLAAAGGDISKIPNSGGFCPMIFMPVTVTASGSWKGHPVSFTKTYGNRCMADIAAGGLFHF